MYLIIKKFLKQNYTYLILAVFAGVLLNIHFDRIFDNYFWGDEAYTIRLARANFWDMLKMTAEDVHPPLYYLFVQVLCKILGHRASVYHLSALI